MQSDPRYLTKSRFKLALECPTKLAYAGDPTYANASLDDSFLAALAEGGHQVGALACAMFPSGIEVDVVGHAAQVARTLELLARENVTIFEAAFEAEGLFVRVDILNKRGDDIELIEVKAKSWRPGRKLDGDFLPYLQDIAFQRHVVGLACPQLRYRCFLMLVDTSTRTSVDGLADRFRVVRHGGRVRVETALGTSSQSLGDSILTAVPVDEQVRAIRDSFIDVGAIEKLGFTDGVRRLAESYRDRLRPPPRPTTACVSCEFRAPPTGADSGLRSGFHECWSERFGLDVDAIDAGTVLDLRKFDRKQALIDQGIVRLSQITTDHIGLEGADPGLAGMGPRHRQWYQASGTWPGNDAFHLGRDGLRAKRETWRFPLHFIDFETCTSPIPFVRGRAPYGTTAFQFSHHVMHADGLVEHRSQFLDATPGRHPNIDFLRALRRALGSDGGTVFRWAAHENTVLCQIRQELIAEPPLLDADAGWRQLP